MPERRQEGSQKQSKSGSKRTYHYYNYEIQGSTIREEVERERERMNRDSRGQESKRHHGAKFTKNEDGYTYTTSTSYYYPPQAASEGRLKDTSRNSPPRGADSNYVPKKDTPTKRRKSSNGPETLKDFLRANAGEQPRRDKPRYPSPPEADPTVPRKSTSQYTANTPAPGADTNVPRKSRPQYTPNTPPRYERKEPAGESQARNTHQAPHSEGPRSSPAPEGDKKPPEMPHYPDREYDKEVLKSKPRLCALLATENYNICKAWYLFYYECTSVFMDLDRHYANDQSDMIEKCLMTVIKRRALDAEHGFEYDGTRMLERLAFLLPKSTKHVGKLSKVREKCLLDEVHEYAALPSEVPKFASHEDRVTHDSEEAKMFREALVQVAKGYARIDGVRYSHPAAEKF